MKSKIAETRLNVGMALLFLTTGGSVISISYLSRHIWVGVRDGGGRGCAGTTVKSEVALIWAGWGGELRLKGWGGGVSFLLLHSLEKIYCGF